MSLWEPSTFTAPLPGNEDLASSGGHWLIEFVEKYVRLESGQLVKLADYEKSILLRALETYPPTWPVETMRGRLRYRTFLLSVARRNHKTSLASYIALYALLRHGTGSKAYLVGPEREHAQTAYKYVYDAVKQSPALSKRIKNSKSRGVQLRNGTGLISILTGDSDTMQGKGFIKGLWILDEAHLMNERVYAAAKASMRSVEDGMILVLSTAGDANSTLYRNLLERARAAIEGADERFGAIVLEGNPSAPLDDVESIKAANPGIDAGYFELAAALDEARDPGITDSDKRRYLHNIQLEHAEESWVPHDDWLACGGTGISPNYISKELVWAVDMAPGGAAASIAVGWDNGTEIETELVASIVNPSIDQLYDAVVALRKTHGRGTYVMYSYTLQDLADRLKERGLEVVTIAGAANARAAGYAYSAIRRHKVRHNNDELLTVQNRYAKQVKRDAGFILNRQAGTEIDAVMATVYAIYGAGTRKENGFIVA